MLQILGAVVLVLYQPQVGMRRGRERERKLPLTTIRCRQWAKHHTHGKWSCFVTALWMILAPSVVGEMMLLLLMPQSWRVSQIRLAMYSAVSASLTGIKLIRKDSRCQPSVIPCAVTPMNWWVAMLVQESAVSAKAGIVVIRAFICLHTSSLSPGSSRRRRVVREGRGKLGATRRNAAAKYLLSMNRSGMPPVVKALCKQGQCTVVVRLSWNLENVRMNTMNVCHHQAWVFLCSVNKSGHCGKLCTLWKLSLHTTASSRWLQHTSAAHYQRDQLRRIPIHRRVSRVACLDLPQVVSGRLTQPTLVGGETKKLLGSPCVWPTHSLSLFSPLGFRGFLCLQPQFSLPRTQTMFKQ